MTFTAVVTGANGGIGGAITSRLHNDGIRVIATDVNPAPAQSIPAGTTYVTLDMLDSRVGYDELFAEVGDGGLDYVVNAAGLAMLDRDGSIVDHHDEVVWDRTMGVNLHGVRRLTVAALPHLRKGRGKSIVNIASIAGLRGMDSPLDAYQVSKAALVSLTRALALRLACEGIRCNALCPGAILTPMIAPLYEQSPERRSDMERRTPIGRLGMPTDVADAAAFLLSSEAAFITATELVVDGGWSAQLK
jgi:NAD(P)-dependent dehydrogenase (short-subunit alcohol dehydrogenase family)